MAENVQVTTPVQTATQNSVPTTPGVNYASFWRRFGAWFLDGAILMVVGFVGMIPVILAAGATEYAIGNPTSEFSPVSNGVMLLGALILGLVGAAYHIFMTGKYGRTIGKMALSIRVSRVDNGQVPGFGKAALRYLLPLVFSFLSIFGGLGNLIDCLWVIWDPKKQALHDKIAGTVVVRA